MFENITHNGHFGAPRVGTPTGEHEGIDIDLGYYGAPFESPVSGNVFFSSLTYGWRYDPLGFLVKVPDYEVYIKDDDGDYWVIAHLLSFGMRPLGRIEKGDIVGYQTDHLHIGKFRAWAGSVSESEKQGLAVEPNGEGGGAMIKIKLGDVLWQIRKVLEDIDTSHAEKNAFAKIHNDPLEVVRHFVRAGKESAVNKLNYQIEKQNNQLGNAQTLLKERTSEVEDLKRQIQELKS